MRNRDADLAFAWHVAEAIVVGILAVLSVIGLGWSIQHRRPRFVETKRPAR
jgi:hypothetical protein